MGSRAHSKMILIGASNLSRLEICCRKRRGVPEVKKGDKSSAVENTALNFDAVRLCLVSSQGSEYWYHRQRSFHQP
jgi:hypothetical protein